MAADGSPHPSATAAGHVPELAVQNAGAASVLMLDGANRLSPTGPVFDARKTAAEALERARPVLPRWGQPLVTQDTLRAVR